MSSVGQYAEAKEALIEAHINYVRCRDHKGIARSLNRLSYVYFQLGDIDAAIESLEKCAKQYHQVDDISNESTVLMNLAALCFRAGKLQKSISLYHQIIGQLEGKDILIAFYNSSIPYALKGDYKTALETIQKTQPELQTYVRDQAIYYENLGLISILRGDYNRAENALNAGLKMSLEIAPESSLVSQIKRLLGDLYVATRKWRLAEKFAREALAVAEKISERVEIAACYRIFAQIEQHKNDDEKARMWFERAIDIFTQIGSLYELAVTRYLAATSGLYESGERTAMLYLAREYFQSEEVSHYVEKIDAQLRRIHIPKRTPANKSGFPCPKVIAVNKEFREILELAKEAARSELSILLTGPTGTGKDILAEFIHYHSGRTGKFVKMNSAAIQNTLMESELFGSTRGAFTGSKDRIGLLEEAADGTFFLNEIADSSPEVQAKLLEALEFHHVKRLGENKVRKVNFRLITATNRDLLELIGKDRFRADLYHRLNEINIDLPPLKDRKEDIPMLTRHFLTFAGFDLTDATEKELDELGSIFMRRIWPGNIRELKAEIQRLWMMARGDIKKIIEYALKRNEDIEREELITALQMAGGNYVKAAKILGVSEGTIRYRIKKYKLGKTK